MSDLGLICAKKDLAANDILYMVEEINDFKGGMAENYVNVQLSINGYHTYKPAYAIKLSAKNFGFETIKKSFLSMPHFVSEINILAITLTENVGVIFCPILCFNLPPMSK